MGLGGGRRGGGGGGEATREWKFNYPSAGPKRAKTEGSLSYRNNGSPFVRSAKNRLSAVREANE